MNTLNSEAALFISNWEGFRAHAYWDVNHWRIGYGSDTEGPDEVPVVKGMMTTVERALQNLSLRVGQFKTMVITELGHPPEGARIFQQLNLWQQVALIDLCYNYGHLPVEIYPGDPERTAIGIKARAGDNNGINRKRRIAEADYYMRPPPKE